MPHQPEIYDVLVVGAGPAGLTTATGLARAGVRVLVVDKHASTSIFPKATGVRPRTMEILRSWGLEQRVHAAGQDVRLQLAVSRVLSAPVVAVESLGVPDPAQICAVSPSPFVFVPQDLLEPVLLGHLSERGGHVRFRTELVGFDLGADGVRARLRPRDGGGPAYEVCARYLVGADGQRSTVRAGLGVDVEQLGAEGEHLTALFTADLGRVLPEPPFALHWVTAPGAEGTFVAAGRHRWTYGWEKDPRHGDLPAPAPGRVRERIRAAAGLPGLSLCVLGMFSWTFGAEVASRYQAGRAFLVGDAAARTTPRRATGMNTGIAAAHNLAWKLAWVLRGWAGEALLDTYEQERRPVGTANALRSLQPRDEVRDAPGWEEFGVTYTSAAIAAADTATPAGTGEIAVPGVRAPHAWLDLPGRRISTLDLFDGRLTLLTGPAGREWRAAADRLAANRAPLTALRFGPDLPDPHGSLARRYAVGEAGAVLIRPDGYVAWRTRSPAPVAAAALSSAIDRATGRSPAAAERPA